MITRFLLSELDSIEAKVHKRLLTMDSHSSDSTAFARGKQTLDFHALQVRIIWSLMKSTAGELQSLFESHADTQTQVRQRGMATDAPSTDLKQPDEELEILRELSKRWGIWRRTQFDTSAGPSSWQLEGSLMEERLTFDHAAAGTEFLAVSDIG